MFQPPQTLIDAVRRQTLVPFIGAGISVGVVHGLSADHQFPDWNGLIARLASRLGAEGKPADAAHTLALLPDTMAAAHSSPSTDSVGRRFWMRWRRRSGANALPWARTSPRPMRSGD